ncbi:MAG: DUF4350 domain-containing protein, partial [Vicinamibacterales bacterium]
MRAAKSEPPDLKTSCCTWVGRKRKQLHLFIQTEYRAKPFDAKLNDGKNAKFDVGGSASARSPLPLATSMRFVSASAAMLNSLWTFYRPAPPTGRPARSTPRARALRRWRAVLPPLMGPFLWLAVFPAERLVAQQGVDTSFRPAIAKPAYPVGAGPVVQIDEGHRNFHQADGRYLPFAELLRRDGYVVRPSRGAFTAEALRSARLLVISNATGEEDGVSAFNAQEIAAVRDWVAEGGSLLLIADHHPWSTAAEALGREFGVRFRTGFVKRQDDPSGRIVFSKNEGTLRDHPITAGLSGVASFAGSAFEADLAEPLMVFGPGTRLIVGDGSDYANSSEAKGLLQGAVLQFGRGRLAIFGEAAMFTAQLSGSEA